MHGGSNHTLASHPRDGWGDYSTNGGDHAHGGPGDGNHDEPDSFEGGINSYAGQLFGEQDGLTPGKPWYITALAGWTHCTPMKR